MRELALIGVSETDPSIRASRKLMAEDPSIPDEILWDECRGTGRFYITVDRAKSKVTQFRFFSHPTCCDDHAVCAEALWCDCRSREVMQAESVTQLPDPLCITRKEWSSVPLK